MVHEYLETTINFVYFKKENTYHFSNYCNPANIAMHTQEPKLCASFFVIAESASTSVCHEDKMRPNIEQNSLCISMRNSKIRTPTSWNDKALTFEASRRSRTAFAGVIDEYLA